MKKCVSLLLILILLSGLAACALPQTAMAQPGAVALGLEKLLKSRAPLIQGEPSEPEVGPEDRVYYGYSAESGGLKIVMTDYPDIYNPKDYCLILRADGTANLKMGEEIFPDFTWTETTLVSGGESLSYTMEGDHLVLNAYGESMSMTFIPAAELEALLNNNQSADPLAGLEALIGGQSEGQSADPMADVREF